MASSALLSVAHNKVYYINNLCNNLRCPSKISNLSSLSTPRFRSSSSSISRSISSFDFDFASRSTFTRSCGQQHLTTTTTHNNPYRYGYRYRYRNKLYYHTTTAPLRLAVEIDVGHGPKLSSSKSSFSFPPISPVQRKAANLELQRMEISTEQIISSLSSSSSASSSASSSSSSDNINTDAFINEVKVVLSYWMSRWNLHFNPYITPSPTNVLTALKPKPSSTNNDEHRHGHGHENTILDDSLYSDYGTNQAMKILFSLLHHNNDATSTITGGTSTSTSTSTHNDREVMIQKILFANDNALIANLIESILIPCTTNSTNRSKTGVNTSNSNSSSSSNHADDDDNNNDQSFTNQQEYIQFSSNTGVNNVQPPIWKECILNASYMLDIMDDLYTKYDIEPNVNSDNVRLFIWSKLVTLYHILEGNNESNHNRGGGHVVDWEDTMNQLVFFNNYNSYDYDYNNNNDNDNNDNNNNKNERSQMKVPTSCQMKSTQEVITQMEETLLKMEKRYYETNNESLKPNVNTYNCVIGALTRSPSPDAPDRTEWYLRRMEKAEDMELNIYVNDDDKDDEDDENLPPACAYADSLSYNLVLNAFSSATSARKYKRHDETIQLVSKAGPILQRMEERFSRIRRETSQPDTFSYSSVLHGYANAGKAPEAERILNKMIALSDKNSSNHMNNNSVEPNLICFNTVIDAWAKTRGRASAENARAILTQMEGLAGVYKDLYPDTISYSSVIAAFSRSGRDDAGDRAEELLQRSLKLYDEGQDGLKPDSITFISVLDALSKQCLRIYQKRRRIEECDLIEERMKAILQQMDDLHDSGDDHVRPCTVSYNILLDFYAKTSQVDKAEECLTYMNEMYMSGKHHVKPDVISYNSVLLALARSNQRGSLEKANDLLQAMKDGSDNIQVKPDIVSYNTVINGFAKSNKKDSNQRVQEMLLSVEEGYSNGTSQVKPNKITYNICIDSWSKSGEEGAINQIEEILEKMIQSNDFKPDVFSFTSTISAIAKSGRRDAPERGQTVLHRMKELGVNPNRYTYNNLINCWSRSNRRGAAEKAEEILIKMTETRDHNVSPDSVTFSSVINCWARSGEKGAGQRAEKILELMENNSLSGNKNMKPNRFTYGSVLNAWAQSCDENAIHKALSILKRMEEMYLSGNDDARPTEPSYNAVINAFAKSTSPTKAMDAETVLNNMVDSYHKGNGDAKPSLRTFGTVLNACAYTDNGSKKEKAAAFKVARRCFKEIISGDIGQPNSITFSLFILSCIKLVPPGTKRDQLLSSVFDECCKRGLVDVKIILDIRRSSPLLRRKLLQSANLENGSIHINDIPAEWRSNIR